MERSVPVAVVFDRKVHHYRVPRPLDVAGREFSGDVPSNKMGFTTKFGGEELDGFKKLLPLIKGTPQEYIKVGTGNKKRKLAVRKIFKEKPHITADNYSSGDAILAHIHKSDRRLQVLSTKCKLSRNN